MESRAKIAAVRARLDELLGASGVDEAPQTVQDGLRETCRVQRASVAEAYAQFAEDCAR